MAEVDINALGDQIANLTLKQAKELSDYIKEKVSKEDADKVKAELTAVGATVEVK